MGTERSPERKRHHEDFPAVGRPRLRVARRRRRPERGHRAESGRRARGLLLQLDHHADADLVDGGHLDVLLEHHGLRPAPSRHLRRRGPRVHPAVGRPQYRRDGGSASYPAPFYGVAQPQPYAYAAKMADAVKPSMYLPIDGERWLLTFSTVTNSYFFTTSLTSSCVPSGGATC